MRQPLGISCIINGKGLKFVLIIDIRIITST